MWKKTGAGAAALVIAATAFAYAQQPAPGNPGGQGGGFGAPRQGEEHEMHGMRGMMGWHRNPQDMTAFAEARIAALHAGLQLNADQEKSWPPVEQALRALAKMRIDRVSA